MRASISTFEGDSFTLSSFIDLLPISRMWYLSHMDYEMNLDYKIGDNGLF